MNQMLKINVRSIALLVTAIFGFTTNVTNASPLKVLAFDDNSCEAWMASASDPDLRRAYVSWALGFLSGYNYANQKQQVTDVSSATVDGYVEHYCKSKSKALFTDAVYRMSDEYSGRAAPILK
jgi:hypothetical protein